MNNTLRISGKNGIKPAAEHKADFGEISFSALKNFYLLFLVVIIMYPLIYVVSSSFSSPEAIMTGKVWLLPVQPTLEGYWAVVNYPNVWVGFANSVFYVVAGTSISIFLTVSAAYPLSRPDLKGRGLIMFMIVITMMFSGGIIPSYLVIYKLGLINTRWALLLPGAITTWNLIITRTYFQVTIPRELLEASMLDGCSDLKFLARIVVPLSKPVIAVNFLFYAINQWNSYFSALLFLNKSELYPLQLILSMIFKYNEANGSDLAMNLRYQEQKELLKYSLIVFSSIPVILLYPFIQKYFVKGVMIGSIKA